LVITDPEKRQIVATILKKMWNGGHFSICEVDRCLSILNVARPFCYQEWHRMHCVGWNDMPKGLPERLMASVLQELSGSAMDAMIDKALGGENTQLKGAALLLESMQK